MSILFRENTTLSNAYKYVASPAAYTILTTLGSNFDIFPDTGVAVGDAVVFVSNFGNYSSAAAPRKYAGINFTLTEALTATSVTGVWEYEKNSSSSTGTGTWVALSNVKDDTNGFTTTGAKTVTWQIPDDWENRTNPLGQTIYYYWQVRYRITAISGQTLGGRNSTAMTAICQTIRLDNESAATFESIYQADKAGTTVMANRSGISATDAVAVTNIDFLRPADYFVMGGAANDVWITISSFTGLTSTTIQLIGTDSAGNSQTEDITFTGNGTTYSTKYWKTLYQTQVTAFVGTGSFSYQAVAGQWGVVSKAGNSQYTFNCNLQTTNSTNLSTAQEQITFLNNYSIMIRNGTGGSFTSGALYSGDKVWKGSSFIFETTGCDYSGMYIANSNATWYNSDVRFKAVNQGVQGIQGYWGYGFAQSINNKIIDFYGELWRNSFMSEPTASVIGVVVYGFYHESTACVNDGLIPFGGPFAFRASNNSNGVVFYRAKMGQVTTACINPWECQGVNGWATDFVDCEWGTFVDGVVGSTNGTKVYWKISSTVTYPNSALYESYSLLMKITNEGGDVVQNARALILKSDGSVHTDSSGNSLDLQTDVDGYLRIDGGLVSSATSNTLTDSSKTWTTNQYKFREVYITAGKGVGQRRIVLAMTGTQITTHADWVVTPDSTSRYIILPILRTKRHYPKAYTANSYQWSDTENYAPFTIKITKSGYNSLTKKLSPTAAIDETLPLKRSRLSL